MFCSSSWCIVQISWKFKDLDSFEDYPQNINAKIEKAHAKGLASVEWTERARQSYKIVFNDWEELLINGGIVVNKKTVKRVCNGKILTMLLLYYVYNSVILHT